MRGATKLDDPTEGLQGGPLDEIALAGETLDDFAAFWDRSARIAEIQAIAADEDDEEGFSRAGLPDSDSLGPLIGRDDIVLEIGCGSGRILRHIAPVCRQVHGVDISAEMIERGRARLAEHDNVVLHHGNGYDLAMIDDESVDVVYSHFALQHMPKPIAFNYVREAWRVLRPGGRFRLQVPNLLRDDHFHQFVFFAQPHFVRHPYPMHFYTPIEVARLLTSTGFFVADMNDYVEVIAHKRDGAGISPAALETVHRSGGMTEALLAERDGLRARNAALEAELERLERHPVRRVIRRFQR